MLLSFVTTPRPPRSTRTDTLFRSSSYSRSPELLACQILFVADPHDIRQSVLQCQPARTGGAICQPCARERPGVLRLPCSAALLHKAGPSGIDQRVNAALCGGGPELRENAGHLRSRQPNPPVCPPSH